MKLFLSLGIVTLLLLPFSVAVAQPYTSEFSQGEIIVDSIKRSTDETVLVKGVIKNTSSKSHSWFGSELVGNFGVIDVRLQDLKTKRQFEQVKVGDKAVGSTLRDSLAPGEQVKFWARITAPPAETKEISIIFSGSALPIDSAKISD
jgi:hypothetical protein